jgi:putative hydrolase of the HAD superfamily
MEKIICLDLDDTLIQTQENYEKINNRLVALLQNEVFIPSEEIIETHCKIDIDLIKTKGFSKDRFPTSWVQTFKYFLGSKVFSEDIVYQEAQKIFSNKINLHKDAKRFLKNIRSKNQEVWIVTHGDFSVQNKRIKDIDLQWVDRIVISEHKNLEFYQSLKSNTSSELIMIGNSVRHDIIPAIEAGFTGIHIQRQNVWKYDVDQSNHNFLSYNSLDYIWYQLFGEES